MNVHLELLRANTPLIDLRSPIEFAKGTFPQSVNLPILNNDERAKIGKTYKHQGNDAAVKLGHRLVSGDQKENRVSGWKEFIEKIHPPGCIACEGDSGPELHKIG